MRRIGIIGALLIGGTAPLSAQAITIASQLLGKVEDVAMYAIVPVSMGQRTFAGTGAGVEFTLGIGEWTRRMTPAEVAAWCVKQRRTGCNVNASEDTATKLVSLRRDAAGRVVDSTFEVTITRLVVPRAGFELTVASKLTPISSADVVPDWLLNGKVLEFPTLTLYTTLRPDRVVAPYFGLSIAPSELRNVTLTRGDSVATIEGSEVGFGASVGGMWAVIQRRFILFGELEYTDAVFDTRGWKRPGDLTADAVPRTLGLQGVRLYLGVQLPLKE